MKKFFISFCDKKFIKTLERIKEEAQQFGVFDHIIGYTENDFDKDFCDKHYEFIKRYDTRGYGFWIWKHYVVYKTLKMMNENDILVYTDGGCKLNVNGKNRLLEYFDIVEKSPHGILSFQMEHLEKRWTKMDLAVHLQCTEPKYLETGQLVGGILIMKKCDNVMEIFRLATELADNHHWIDDSMSTIPNAQGFYVHRHDQSILSLLRKKYGTEYIKRDETYFHDFEKEGQNYPIWAKRLKF